MNRQPLDTTSVIPANPPQFDRGGVEEPRAAQSLPKGVRMNLPTTMKATVLTAPHRFEVLERPVPIPGDEDVLVRVRACGI